MRVCIVNSTHRQAAIIFVFSLVLFVICVTKPISNTSTRVALALLSAMAMIASIIVCRHEIEWTDDDRNEWERMIVLDSVVRDLAKYVGSDVTRSIVLPYVDDDVSFKPSVSWHFTIQRNEWLETMDCKCLYIRCV
jgi:hypothetical protein